MFFNKRIAQLDFRTILSLKKSLENFPTLLKQDVVEQFKSQLLKLVNNVSQFIELNSDNTKPIAFELAKDLNFAKKIIKSEADVKHLFAHTLETNVLAVYCLLNTLFQNNCAPKECLDFSILR